uniref:TFIIS N-terminal domain-containing protein n=1 Tax=Kalanchoe fedtschenkoi TaxID=63787 RepID=A0A7N0RA78_KALFE
MALEDFFTLAEVKAGLTSPDRVEDLINLMQKDKHKDVRNVGETLRQWDTVARTIVCTDNKECLDQFVQLEGLCIINVWLNDIQKCASDIPESFMEETIVVLLQAIEKLQTDDEKLTSSGIRITVESLLVHNSSVVKHRAGILLDIWKQRMNITSKVAADVAEDMSVGDCKMASKNQTESSSIGTFHVDDLTNENKCANIGRETSNSGTPDPLPSEKVKDIRNAQHGSEVGISLSPDREAVKDGTLDSPHSMDLCIVKEKESITGPISGDANLGFTSIRKQSPPNSGKEAGAESPEQSIEVVANVDEDKEIVVTTNSVENLRADGHPSFFILPGIEVGSLGSDEPKLEQSATEAAQQDIVMVAAEREDNSIQEKLSDGLSKELSNFSREEASSHKILSAKELPSNEVQIRGSDNISYEAKDNLYGIEPYNADAVVQETDINTRKGILGFDLNEEVWSEDVDPSAVPNQELYCDRIDRHLMNQTSMPASVVSASKASAIPGLPAGGLESQGTLGSNGSAAASAFLPASPNKPLQNDNVSSSTGPSSRSPKQRQHVHDFDLNMADTEDDRNADGIPDYMTVVSSSHPFKESCLRISERVELDLNSLGDTAPPSASWGKNGLPFSQQNACIGPSPASWSSPLHPSMWDVDLNKKISIPNVRYDPQTYMGKSSFNMDEALGVRKPADSGISIMGTQVDVGRKEPSLQSPFLPNVNMTGLGNTIRLSPPLQSYMYGPIMPISFDSRGSPVLPHMMGPAQPPYLMNMMGAPPAPSGVRSSSCSSFDLNKLYMNDPGKRDDPYPRQFLMSSQGGFLEPHSSAFSHEPPSCPTKRKEPHSGWDPYHHGS